MPMGTALDAYQTKTLALEAGFDLVGVLEPAHTHGPAWARSVLVVAYATLDEAYDYSVYVEVRGRRRWSKLAYEVLVARAARLALALRDRGVRADPLTYEDSAAIIDLRRAAVAAGLGVTGKNELVVSRDFGPHIRLGAVFTDLPLPPDRPLSEYFCSSCSRCWSACPTGALGPEGLDRSRCLAEFAPTPEMLARQKREWRQLTPFTRLQCSACVTACPIGARLAYPYWDGE
jgi:epoxyqueuosine reductase QueG